MSPGSDLNSLISRSDVAIKTMNIVELTSVAESILFIEPKHPRGLLCKSLAYINNLDFENGFEYLSNAIKNMTQEEYNSFREMIIDVIAANICRFTLDKGTVAGSPINLLCAAHPKEQDVPILITLHRFNAH